MPIRPLVDRRLDPTHGRIPPALADDRQEDAHLAGTSRSRDPHRRDRSAQLGSSTTTASPAEAASSACSAWSGWGVHRMTASTPPRPIVSLEPGVGPRAEPLGEGAARPWPRPATATRRAPGTFQRRGMERGDLAGTDQREADLAAGVSDGSPRNRDQDDLDGVEASMRKVREQLDRVLERPRCSMRAARPRGGRRWRVQPSNSSTYP